LRPLCHARGVGFRRPAGNLVGLTVTERERQFWSGGGGRFAAIDHTGHCHGGGAATNGNHDIPGDYSPAGGKIVFLRITDPDSETGTLFVVNTDGSGLRRITAPGFAEDSGSWSPDGIWILFSSNNQKLFVVHPDGTGLHQISLDISGGYLASEPAWSPDGTKIVLRLFLASTGERHLYTVQSTGSDPRQVANTQSSEEFPDWGSHPLADTKT
jgi:Tol biopolymer transport system component